MQRTVWPIREVFERPSGYSTMNDRGENEEEMKSIEGFVSHEINIFFSKCDFKKKKILEDFEQDEVKAIMM